jgi:hypothetical protein
MVMTLRQPDWIVDELPPQYAAIAEQIAALRQQAREYEEVATALWQTGPPLVDAVALLFRLMQCDVEVMDSSANYDARVQLQSGARFLMQVAGSPVPLDRRSPEIARILRTLQEDAEPTDRVLLALNIAYDVPPAARRDELATPDAMRLIQGLGANLVPTSTLFGLWKYSLQDAEHVQKTLQRLHELHGGIFR